MNAISDALPALRLSFRAVLPLFFFWLILAGWLRAEDGDGSLELIEELPFGESPVPQEAGEFQIGLGAQLFQSGASRETELVVPVEYGVTDWLQIGVEVPYWWDDEEGDGFGDLEAGMLITPYRDERFILSVAIEAGLDTANTEDDEGVVWEPMILAGVRLNPGVLYLGFGGEYGDEEPGYQYHVAYVAPSPIGTAILELNGESGEEEEALYLTPAIAWEVLDDAELLLGAPIGLTEESADWGLVLKLTFEF